MEYYMFNGLGNNSKPKNQKKKLNKILAKNTKQNIKKIEKDTERDNYFNAKEALEYGIVDKII